MSATMTDEERLAAYDAFAEGVRSELADTVERMESLKAAGKVKSATYRQLFAARMELKAICDRLARFGL